MMETLKYVLPVLGLNPIILPMYFGCSRKEVCDYSSLAALNNSRIQRAPAFMLTQQARPWLGL